MTIRTSRTNFKTRDDSAPKIEGYFVVFGDIYDICPGGQETVDPHAFDEAIEGKDIRCLIDHETRLVLGRTTAGTLSLSVDEHGVFGSVSINPDDSDAMNLYARVKRGDVTQCSFGFDILDEETTNTETGVLWTIKSVKLYEVSVVTFPAYESTEVEARSKELSQIKHKRLEAWKASIRAKLKRSEH